NGSGTGPLGNMITRTGNYTVGWDTAAGCLSLDGSWMTTVGARTWTTAVTSFRRCQNQCPSSGTIDYHGGFCAHVTLTFNGSAVAQWTTTNASGTVNLLCNPVVASP